MVSVTACGRWSARQWRSVGTRGRDLASYSTGTGNRLSNDGTWAYTYDDEGNLTKKSKGAADTTWTYGYDHDNHMTWARKQATDGGALLSLVTYAYDALGLRVSKEVWTSAPGGETERRFAYDGDSVWADQDASGGLIRRYLWGDAVDQLFARVESDGSARWLLTDRLGSVRDVTGSAGAVVDHLD